MQAPADDPIDWAVDAALTASRALERVSATVMVELAPELTLTQIRVLEFIASEGSTTGDAIALELSVRTLAVDTTIASLTRFDLAVVGNDDRATPRVRLTARGRELASALLRRRREELQRIMSNLEPVERALVVHAFRRFGASSCPDFGDDPPVT